MCQAGVVTDPPHALRTTRTQPRGTCVRVSRLFVNLPVRRQQLAAVPAAAEWDRIRARVVRCALAQVTLFVVVVVVIGCYLLLYVCHVCSYRVSVRCSCSLVKGIVLSDAVAAVSRTAAAVMRVPAHCSPLTCCSHVRLAAASDCVSVVWSAPCARYS